MKIARGDPIIVCSAVRVFIDIGCNNFTNVIIGARHWDQQMHDQFANLPFKSCVKREFECQGFIDQFGNFYDRKEAFVIANRNKQIRFNLEYESNELFSEMLY